MASARATSSRLRSGSVSVAGDLAALVEQVEMPEHLVRAPARHHRVGPMQQGADDDVVLDRERRKRTHQLEGAADAAPADDVGPEPVDALAGEMDRAVVGREHAGDDVEQRGLAGAIGTDDREDSALRHAEADIVDREQAAEALAQPGDLEQRRHCFPPFAPRPSMRESHGQTPSGSTITTTSRHTP